MAQDSSQNARQDVDLDELVVEILIVAKNQTAMQQAATFLTRRGWPAVVISNLSEAVEFIAEKKPDFVLISFSNSNPAIQKLPGLISQSFGLTCVGFVETTDTASNARLNNFKMRHKVQGSASGPSVHRFIRKILAERFNVAEERSQKGKQHTGNDSRYVTVKGEASETDRGSGSGGVIVQKSDTGTEQNKKSSIQMMKGDAGSEDTANGANSDQTQSPEANSSRSGASGENDVVASGKYTMAKRKTKSLKQLAQERGQGAGPNAVENGVGLEGTNGSLGLSAKDLAAQLKASLLGQSSVKPDLDQDPPDSGLAVGDGVAPQDPLTSNIAPEDGPSSQPAVGSVSDPSGNEAYGQLKAELEQGLPEGSQSVIEKAVQYGLEAVCNTELTQEIEKVLLIRQVGVFPISSPLTPGYLVVVWQHEEEENQVKFLKDCEEALIKAFLEMGVPGTIEPGFLVPVPDVLFHQWADAKARFQTKLMHENREVAAAFFDTNPPIPRVREGEDAGMYAIGIDAISSDQPVTFKAYLHLRKNQKYFLYLRNGRRLQPEQRERLRGKNVKDFFMKSVDIENLRMFLAAAFLADSIKNSGEDAA